MTRRVHFLLVTAVFTSALAACRGPLLGIVTETYVNQNDSTQILELTTKDTLKGFIAGMSPNPQGRCTLLQGQKVSTGTYAKVQDSYIVKLNDNRELKIALQKDSTLRDEAGNIWRQQSRSRSFRPPEDDLASR